MGAASVPLSAILSPRKVKRSRDLHQIVLSNLEGLPADLGIETGEGYLAVMGQGKSEP